MAGIVGIYCADGRAADVSELKRMVSAVEHRGPDGIHYWQSGPVAFAHLQFSTTPESREERQPLLSACGEVCLIWDGRIDNREELIEALESHGARPVDNTDPGLVLAAYLAWGPECVQRFVGDFALAVWDGRLRRLWCARDYIGIRPFYYFWDGKTFLFAPEIRALLAHPLVSLRINEGMAGEYLATAITSRDETLYSDIRRLPSGSTLRIDAGGFRIDTWWRPELSLLEYGTDDEYAKQFLHLMEQSVGAMTRSCGPWGVPLSGGLDSSTIAVTAQSLFNRNGSERRVATISMAVPGKPWDESEYISEIARFAGLQTEFFPSFHAGEEFFREQAEWSREFPDHPNGGPMMVPLFGAAKRHGMRVLLTGLGGNEWLEGWPWHVADLVRSLVKTGAVRQSLGQVRDEWKSEGGNGNWSMFLLRQLLKEAAPGWVGMRRKKTRFARESFLSKEFLQRTHLPDRVYAAPERQTRSFASREQEFVFLNAVSGREAHVLELNDRTAAQAGLESRHPFFDRRIAEFCLCLPREQRQRGDAWKWVLRNAMRGRLPERVRTKTIQAEFSELAEGILYEPWARGRLKNSIMGKETDWLDLQRFAEWMNLPEQPPSTPSHPYRSIWMVVGMDLWLENVLSSGGRL